MRRLWSGIRRAAVRAWRVRHLVPLTPLGAALALVGWWVGYRLGTREVDYVLRAGGLVALGSVAVTLLVVLCATLRVWLAARRQRVGPDLRLEAGLTGSGGLRLGPLARWPLVHLRVEWEEPLEAEVTLAPDGEELVRPLSRGEAVSVKRRLLVEDIFGFARLGLPLSSAQRVRVEPSRARVTAHVVTRFSGGDALSYPSGPAEGELIEMRRYVHGDPLRHVLWKAFARTRKLLVRTPETAITPRPSAMAYFVAGPGDEPAASAARFFVEEGLLGREFLFSADGADAPTGEGRIALDQLVASARHRGAGGAGLAGFLGRIAGRRPDSIVLFVPPLPGAWLERVRALGPKLRGARVITAVDLHPEPAPGRVRRLLFAPVDRSAAHAARRLARVLRTLREAGLSVQVLHRPSGELLGRAQLEALVELRA